jgi:Dyp-type peroxidase family
MLELDAIQSTLLRPVLWPGRLNLTRYVFVRIDAAPQGREWVQAVAAETTSVVAWDAQPGATVNVAFTFQGLTALELPEAALASFADEFRLGMAARKLLGDEDASDPARWDSPLGTAAVHGLLILSAHDQLTLDAQATWHDELLQRTAGVAVVFEQDGWAPEDRREHFGYRGAISQPAIEGSGVPPRPGQGTPLKAGEFGLGYPDESGQFPAMPEPEQLGRNGSYLVVRKLYQDVAAFRAFLTRQGGSPEGSELLAAKMVGRWRSGAPLVLAPEHDDPALGADPQRNNDFEYAAQDPQGLACPLGAHIRRANPRDALNDQGISTVRRHRILQAGSLYGPPLPEGAPDDGVDRGIMFLCVGASIRRQFEFVHNVWMNDGVFVGLGSAKDPLTGAHDAADFMVIPKKPIRRRIQGLPRFVTMRGGEYFFLPSLRALDFIGGV